MGQVSVIRLLCVYDIGLLLALKKNPLGEDDQLIGQVRKVLSSEYRSTFQALAGGERDGRLQVRWGGGGRVRKKEKGRKKEPEGLISY